MAAPVEIVTIPLEDEALDPLTVFGTLRSFTPDRGAFLLEAIDREGEAGRYSVAGYRVRGGEMLPPAADVIRDQLDALAGRTAPASLAQALATAAVGYIAYEQTHTSHAIRHWDDELASGVFLVGATIVLFDHQERTATVAGPKAGRVAERCAWELRNGPRPEPLAAFDPQGVPANIQPMLSDDQLVARCTRAQRYVLDPVERLALAQGFQLPLGEVDPFEIYRALRHQSNAAAGYFIDFGFSPLGPRVRVLGTSAPPCVVVRPRTTLAPAAEPGDGSSTEAAEGRAAERVAATAQLDSALRACFPHPAVVGREPVDAARVVRRLEESSREVLGSLVGYLAAGGGGCFALAERPIVVREEQVTVQVAVPIDPQSDATKAPGLAREAVRAELAALASARAGS